MKYFNACTSIIAKGNEDDLGELANEVFVSIEPIMKQCKQYDRDRADEAKRRGETYVVDETTRIAFSLLDLWSDPNFCKTIVCRSPGTAIEVFKQISNLSLYDGGAYALSQELLHQAFSNRDSILMRESRYSGLGFFKLFTNTVFDNMTLVESNHRPLQAWSDYQEDQIKPWQVEKYCACLNVAVEAYFKAKNFHQYPSALYVGLDKLGGFALSQTALIKYLSDSELYQSNNLRVLSKIQMGFEQVVDITEKYQDDIPEYELNVASYDRFNDNSIYGVIAYGIYHYFEHLAVTWHDKVLRHDGIGIWLKIFGVRSSTLSKYHELPPV